MKVCKYCGSECRDNVEICQSCGAKEFDHKCENCGKVFDSEFCPSCGTRAGTAARKCPCCGKEYFSNACPDCGYLPQGRHDTAYEPGNSYAPPQKRKTWLWVLGWIFIFPLPLTLIIIKKENLHIALKAVIIIAAWLFYFGFVYGTNDDTAQSTSDTAVSQHEQTTVYENYSESIDSVEEAA